MYLTERLSNDRSFEEGALYAGKNALIYDSVQEEGNIYTVLKNSNKKYVDNFEVIKGELFYFSQNENEKKWAKEIGIKVSPYIIIDGELMSSDRNLDLMDEATGSIVIPQNVTKIGAGAFRDVPGLRSIVIPGTVKEIGENAFSGNPTLENVIIEEGVEKIGAQAFFACSALKTIKIADSVSSIGQQCFFSCTALTEINFPKSLKEIPMQMVAACKSITQIVIPEGITKIGGYAFWGCSDLKEVEIPSTVTIIDGGVFLGDYKLTKIEISENNETYSFANNSLMSKDGKNLYFVLANTTEISIPETVENIQAGVFESYPRQVVLNIPKSVKSIQTTFGGLITRINVAEENPNFKSVDGNLYTKDMKKLIRYTQNQTAFIMPNEVTRISNKAFLSASNLKNLTLSENLENIGGFQFQGTKITDLHFPAKMKDIDYSITFYGVNINITIAEDNPYLKTLDGTIILGENGKKLVAISKDLETYNIPNSVETIGNYTIYAKNNLKEIELPNSVKNIYDNAFDASTNLQRVQIGSNIEKISKIAFTNCSSLREIVIDKKENEIANAPWGCPFGLRAIKWK